MRESIPPSDLETSPKCGPFSSIPWMTFQELDLSRRGRFSGLVNRTVIDHNHRMSQREGSVEDLSQPRFGVVGGDEEDHSGRFSHDGVFSGDPRSLRRLGNSSENQVEDPPRDLTFFDPLFT
jgi:hypothetical protein